MAEAIGDLIVTTGHWNAHREAYDEQPAFVRRSDFPKPPETFAEAAEMLLAKHLAAERKQLESERRVPAWWPAATEYRVCVWPLQEGQGAASVYYSQIPPAAVAVSVGPS